MIYAKQRLPKSFAAVAAGLADSNNEKKFVIAALSTPLNLLPSILIFFEGQKDLEFAYKAILAGLTNPANEGRLVRAALRSSFDFLPALLAHFEGRKNLEPAYKAIVAGLTNPANKATLVGTTLRTSLEKIVSFFRYAMSNGELRELPGEILTDIDEEAWNRARRAGSIDHPSSMHSAATLFQQLGRSDLMVVPAQIAILRADISSWHAPGVGIHHLGQTLRLGHAVDRDTLQRFLRIVVTGTWLKSQYEAAGSGSIAATLVGLWLHYDQSVIRQFVTAALGRRLAAELSRLHDLVARELAGALSLFGCCNLIAKVPLVSPKWPTPAQIQEMLRSSEPEIDLKQLSNATALCWLGLRELVRLMPAEIKIPSELGEPTLALWQKVESRIDRHLRLNNTMISWLRRCSESDWRLIREPYSLYEELAPGADNGSTSDKLG